MMFHMYAIAGCEGDPAGDCWFEGTREECDRIVAEWNAERGPDFAADGLDRLVYVRSQAVSPGSWCHAGSELAARAAGERP